MPHGRRPLNPGDPCEEETASRQHHHPVGGRRPGDHTGPPTTNPYTRLLTMTRVCGGPLTPARRAYPRRSSRETRPPSKRGESDAGTEAATPTPLFRPTDPPQEEGKRPRSAPQPSSRKHDEPIDQIPQAQECQPNSTQWEPGGEPALHAGGRTRRRGTRAQASPAGPSPGPGAGRRGKGGKPAPPKPPQGPEGPQGSRISN